MRMFPIEVSKKLAIVVTSIIAIALLALLVWFWYQAVTPSTVVDGGEIGDGNGAEEMEEGEIDTSEWEVYRNEEWGFEVRYPREWVVISVPMNGDAHSIQHVGLRPDDQEDFGGVMITLLDDSPRQPTILEWANDQAQQSNLPSFDEDDLVGYPGSVLLARQETWNVIERYHSAFSARFMSDTGVLQMRWYDQEQENEAAYRIFTTMLGTVHVIN